MHTDMNIISHITQYTYTTSKAGLDLQKQDFVSRRD